jgi:DNA-binding CsgD family transcriptional regulator
MGKIEQVRLILQNPFAEIESLNEDERQVLQLASRSLTNEEIANRLNITEALVAYRLRNGLLKINAKKKELPNMIIRAIEQVVG